MASPISPTLQLQYAIDHPFRSQSEGDASDEQRIPPGGTPSYQWMKLYNGWQLTPDLLLTLQINNLFDEAYRSHGSGSNEPGRNYIFGSTIQF